LTLIRGSGGGSGPPGGGGGGSDPPGGFSEAALGEDEGEDFKGDFGWWIAHLSSVQIDRSLGRCDGIGVARIHRD